ncbi:MAG: hypothetical protein KJO01_09865 [Gammaproteobacteria bacterium]|nr:hypothetical protein [Gammaproteobacteria bacterium]MBT8110520.1 hypothetical protein [Gammaproteobacteria bacterium]NND46384.1 hypothetical protein [Woeseiaceae bacterium]NNL45220.1 hypothetical protein [Woeseiaceae bacterium]
MNLQKSIAALACVVLTALALASPAPETDLKKIMQDLRNNTVSMLDALLIDDFAAVAVAANGIAHHPSIPAAQVQLVAKELGPEMLAFKQFDQQVHDLSLSIMAAAKEQDRARAIADYQHMLNGCLACHAAYKERVSKVLSAVDDIETRSNDPL